MLDGTTKSPDSFSGPIGKSLNGEVSSWPVAAHFKSIPNPHFVKLPVSVIEDLSADQHYAYKICSAVIEGVVDQRLAIFESWSHSSFAMAYPRLSHS